MNEDKNSAIYYVEGVITTTNKGLGFVSVGDDSPRENNIRIEAGFLKTALPKDRVKVLLHAQKLGMQQTGEIVEILARARTTFVGTIEEDATTFCVPQDTRIYIDFLIPNPPHGEKLNGKKVLIRLTHWDDPKKNPEGEIIEVIGNVGENETEIRALVLERGLALELPEKINEEAKILKQNAPAFILEESKKRRDFRGVATCTIDPVDAKDFDDAISVQTLTNGDIEIGVHIADVSAYIKPHTTIDEEARDRATSVYLVDRVIPMFPEILSNNLCSLVQDEDKLVFSAVFTFSPDVLDLAKGTGVPIKDIWFGRSIILSKKRFAYEEAQKVLDTGTGVFYKELAILNTIAKKLTEERRKAGAISFEHEEVGFILDEKKKPVRVYKKIFQDTNKLVEEFMLLANKEVAKFVSNKITGGQEKNKLIKQEVMYKNQEDDIFVYRIHDEPKPERLTELNRFISSLGYKLYLNEEGRASSSNVNKLLDHAKGKPEEELLSTITIRTMAKAIYSINNIGHYGLAFPFYTHFTSPIRRYPDVMVHRLLAHYLDLEKISKAEMHEYIKLCAHSSEMEKTAADAERTSIKFKQAEYMQERIGKEFDGTISNVAEFGIFVEEIETKCEGLIRMSELGNDFFIFEKDNYRIVGKNTKITYALTDKVRIRVKAVNMEQKSIDYELVK